jgi:hypothetical protein
MVDFNFAIFKARGANDDHYAIFASILAVKGC